MAFQNLKSTGIAYLLGKLKTVFLQIKDAVKTVNGIEPDEDGDITIRTVPYAQNLESESSQKDYSVFVERSTGGLASVNSGDAWLMSVMGNNVHDGFVPESIDMEVDSDAITATINRDTFVGAVADSGTTVLTFTSSWSADPATYGITVTGTPTSGDKITVVYVKEVRGTITVANPQKLIATGWNLYNHNSGNGYAKVVKYDDEMAYMIDGSYTALKFSATEDGTRTDITVTDGNFNPFANTDATSGYVWVTGGSASDTAIWMTWSDWTDSYDGEFMAYTENEVNFSSIMTSYFPYGLMKAGSVADEIDFNLKQAISRVERITYSAENRAAAESSGRDFEFDEDYIYLARTSSDIAQNTHTIAVSGEISVHDHGLEFFTETDVGVNSQILYGSNLKNKLERDVLTISAQSLESSQKSQVRSNIGAASSTTVSNLQTMLTPVDVISAVTFREQYNNNRTFFLKIGKIVWFSYMGEGKTHSNNDEIFVVGNAIKPATNACFAFVSNALAYGNIFLTTAGSMYINQISDNTQVGRIYFHGMYICA